MLFADNSSAVWISKSSSRWIWDVAQIGTVVTSTKDKAWKWRYSLQNCCKLATLSFAQASKVKLIQNTTYMPCCFFVPVSTSFFLNNIQCDSRRRLRALALAIFIYALRCMYAEMKKTNISVLLYERGFVIASYRTVFDPLQNLRDLESPWTPGGIPFLESRIPTTFCFTKFDSQNNACDL